MGKVIPFHNKKSPTLRKSQTAALDQGALKEIAEGAQLLEVKISRVFEIKMYLNSLAGQISGTSVATARKSLKSFTLDELNTIAEESCARDWQMKPGYFTALVDEVVARDGLLGDRVDIRPHGTESV